MEHNDFVINTIQPGKILLVGEAMTLFSAEQKGACSRVRTFRASVAGAELNVSVGLSRLEQHPLYATRLGNDIFAERILQFMSDNRMDTSLITIDSIRHTGFMLKSKVVKGDPQTFYFRNESAASAITVDFVRSLNMRGVSSLHVTGILPALSPSCMAAVIELLHIAHERHMFVSFDPNIRIALWKSIDKMRNAICEIARQCDLVLPGLSEGRLLFGTNSVRDTAKAFLNNGSRLVIVKDGPRGAYATDGLRETYVPGFIVDHVVDTVGCGDGFAAGVLSKLLENSSIEEACERGCAVGAIQTQQTSDNEGLPTPSEISAFMASHQRVS